MTPSGDSGSSRPSFYDRRDALVPQPIDTISRVAIYARQSKANEKHISIDTQLERSEAFAARSFPGAEIVLTAIDRNRPAKEGALRPELDRLITAARNGEFDALVAYSAARLGRDMADAEEFYRLLKALGIRMSSIDFPDLESAAMRGFAFGTAQDENKVRTRYKLDDMIRRHEAGLIPNPKTTPKYGLRWNAENPEILEAHPDQLPWVIKLHEVFVEQELSYAALKRWARAQGIRRPRSGDTAWASGQMKDMMGNPWYEGRVHVDYGRAVWDAGTTFVPIELLERARARAHQISLGRRGGPKHGSTPRKPVSGLLFCAGCRGWGPFHTTGSYYDLASGEERRRARFRCQHHDDEDTRVMCPTSNSVAYLGVEDALMAMIIGTVDRKRVDELRGQSSNLHRIRSHEGRLKKIRERQDALVRSRDEGEVRPDRIYNQEMQKLIDQEKVYEELLRNAVTFREAHMGVWERTVNRLERDGRLTANRWREMDWDEKRDILRTCFPHGVFVHPAPRNADVLPRLEVRTAEDQEEAERRMAMHKRGEAGWETVPPRLD